VIGFRGKADILIVAAARNAGLARCCVLKVDAPPLVRGPNAKQFRATDGDMKPFEAGLSESTRLTCANYKDKHDHKHVVANTDTAFARRVTTGNMKSRAGHAYLDVLRSAVSVESRSAAGRKSSDGSPDRLRRSRTKFMCSRRT
jgi:hypothetical protein